MSKLTTMWANDTSGAAISSSPLVYRGLEELTYPFHEGTFTVTTCGAHLLQGPEGESEPGLRGTCSSGDLRAEFTELRFASASNDSDISPLASHAEQALADAVDTPFRCV